MSLVGYPLLQTGTPAPGGTGGGEEAAGATLATPVANFLAGLGVPGGIADVLGGAITFAVVLGAFYLVGRLFVVPLVDRVLEARGLDTHAKRPLRKIANVVVVFVGIAVGFGFAGYGDFLQSLATVAAAATLAIGFAMQDVIKNFVAGIFIFTDRPFRIGDWIEWDGNSGIVEDISFRVSRVRTFDNELLTVPNSQLTDGVIKNPVAKDTLRLQFLFGIGYGDDIEHATEIIVEEAERHPDILADPAPSVRLTELADSYVGLKSRIWIANPSRADFVKIRGDYVTAVKQRFDEEGIEIPFPQRDLSGNVELNTPVEGGAALGDD
ncbi:mechanosensitive ion channel family protein [Halobaculum lipolyticum]|uniref:Mechanosensitive ion channel family protein n=1 Tax=Halobaculum lipolyticum TaxID=3032001 RepID=A0ABD5W7M2_9EURY|nr:mechanosensitive ion channel family protein [Halobaculum sp. DT31]